MDSSSMGLEVEESNPRPFKHLGSRRDQTVSGKIPVGAGRDRFRACEDSQLQTLFRQRGISIGRAGTADNGMGWPSRLLNRCTIPTFAGRRRPASDAGARLCWNGKEPRRVRTLQFDAVVFRKRCLPRAACRLPNGEEDGISGIVCPTDCPNRWDKRNRVSQVICNSQLARLGSFEAERSGFEPEMPVSRHTGLAIRAFGHSAISPVRRRDCQSTRRPLRTASLGQATQA